MSKINKLNNPTQVQQNTSNSAGNNSSNKTSIFNGQSNVDDLSRLIYSNEFLSLTFDEKVALIKEKNPQWSDAEIKTVVNYLAPQGLEINEAQRKESSDARALQDYDFVVNNIDKVIPKEVLETDVWKNMSPNEKLDFRLNAFLSQYLGEYDSNDKEMADYQKELLLSVILDGKDWEQMPPDDLFINQSETNKLYKRLQLAQTLDYLETEFKDKDTEIGLYDFMNLDKDEQKSHMMLAANRLIDDAFINNDTIAIDNDVWADKYPEKKLSTITKTVYAKLDPSLDDETLNKLSKIFAQEMAQRHGITDDASSTDKLLNQANQINFLQRIEALKLWNSNNKDNPIRLEDLKDPRILADVMSNYEEINNIELTQDAKLYRAVVQELGGKAVNGQDIYNHLKQQDPKHLSSYEKRLLKYYKESEEKYNNKEIGQEQYEAIFTLTKKDPSETISYQIMNRTSSLSPEETKQYCKENGLLPNNFDKWNPKRQTRYLERYGKTIQYLKDNNITPEEFKKLSQEEQVEFLNKLFEGDPRYSDSVIRVLGLSNEYMQQLSKDLHNDVFLAQIDLVNDVNDRVSLYANAAQQFKRGSKEQITAVDNVFKDDNYSGADKTTQESIRQELAYLSPEVSAAQLKDGWTDTAMSAYGTAMANDNNIPVEYTGNYISYTQEHAPNDEFRYNFGTKVAQNTTNPDVLEYLGAATQYFESDNYRNQYVNAITTAAQNYSPEVQQAVQTAIETGTVSSANTVIEAESMSPATATASTATASTASAATAKGSAPAEAPAASPAAQPQNITTPSETTYTSNYNPTPSVINPVTFTSHNRDDVSAQTSEEINKTNSASSNKQTNSKEINDAKWTQEAEAKKKETLEKIENVKKAIDNAKEEWELKHDLQLTEEEWEFIESELSTEIAVEGLEDTKMPQTEKSRFIARLKAATSFNERYDILLSAFGQRFQDRFIERLASHGSVDRINEFLSHRGGDTNILKTLYLRCSGEGIKKELLNMLPSETIEEMLAAGDITNIGDVNYKIIQNYVLKNIYSMSNSDFTKYLKYLPLDIREKLTEQRNIARGNINNPINTNGEAHQADMPSVTAAQGNKNFETTTDKKTKQPMSQAQGLFKNGETTTRLSDGRIATKNGTSFGAISDNFDDDAYRIIDPKSEGAPIGMDDEVLTPGSVEWNKKYNHNNVAATAFTMAALDNEEEFDDFGIPFGSNKVGMGKKIKKKYKPGGFNTKS